ncbi:MAG: hypothetical protein OEY23_23395, partial [Acidimicrobiia bacterium]|nr:hypothetical protein [Acidimicrobiia bacterium]
AGARTLDLALPTASILRLAPHDPTGEPQPWTGRPMPELGGLSARAEPGRLVVELPGHGEFAEAEALALAVPLR